MNKEEDSTSEYLDAMFKKLGATDLEWDTADNSPDVLDDTPIVIQVVSNGNEKNPKHQVYLRTSLTNNNLLRIPIPNTETKEQALVDAYNCVAGMLDAIADEINENSDAYEEMKDNK